MISSPKSFIEKIKGDDCIALSPMANFSDSPYRRLCREFGAAFSFTEFISTDAICRKDPKALELLRFTKKERPIVFQIFGNDANKLLYAASFIEEFKPDGIDINMGCSVRFVAHKGSGAGMLRNPVKTGAIVARLTQSLQTPVSAKIRLGWNHKQLNYIEQAHMLEDNGISFLSVHGRTKEQGYKGKADWDAIADIKSRISIPVLGNGDLLDRQQARQAIRKYNLDGALIGRSAIGNPAIFHTDPDFKITPLECLALMLKHWGLYAKFKNIDEAEALKLFRKHSARYLQQAGIASDIRHNLLTCSDPKLFQQISLDLQESLRTE